MPMKKKFLVPLTLLGALGLSGCLPEQEAASTTSTTVTTTDTNNGGSDGNTDGNTGGNTGVSGATCSGSSSDGEGDGYSLHQFNLMMAGHQSWLPGTYTDPLATQSMPTLTEASIIFRSDAKLKVRFKVHSQPYPTAGQEYCYGRNTGQGSDAYPYTKLRFMVHLRDVLCAQENVDPQNSNNCLNEGFYLGARYRTQYIDPVSVDSCSPVIDFSAYRNQTQYGTVVEVEDVKADSTCQSNDTYCPAEKIVREASCWRLTMQVATDYTQDFK
jgi:hypothetical protein